MKRIILGAVLALLVLPATASAHHLDTAKSSLDAACTGGKAALVGFRTSDGPVAIRAYDGQTQIASVNVPAFYGDKLVPLTWAPLTKGTHTVTVRAEWPTRGSNNGTYSATVVCPGPPIVPPIVPPPVTPPTTPAPPVVVSPPVTPPTTPPVAPPTPPCAVGKASRIRVVRDGRDYIVRGRKLTRIRWFIDGKLYVRGLRRVHVSRSIARHTHIVQVEAIAFGCLKVSAFRTVPRPATPPRFTG